MPPGNPNRPLKLSDDQAVRYCTKIDDQVAGPYTFEGIESLVFLHKITADTLIAREGSGEFTPLKATELGPVLFPTIHLPKPPQDWAPPGQENLAAHANRQRYRMTEAIFDKVNAAPGQLPRIEVHEILDGNRQAEIEAGLDLPPPPSRFRISKRSLDFWFMVIAGNALILGGAIYFQNTASLVFGIAGSGLYTFGLVWCLYGVMDRY